MAEFDSSAGDREVVARQLGRRSIQPFKVVRRCPAGFPMVIQTDPIPDAPGQSPLFTTLYWLTCPVIMRHVSRHESEGRIGVFESEMAADPGLQKSMHALHAEYAASRREAIGANRMAALRVEQPRVARFMDETGIAGVSDPARLKCLHAHAAFHLARGGHPIFEAHPDLLPDVSGCRECETRSGRPNEGA